MKRIVIALVLVGVSAVSPAAQTPKPVTLEALQFM
jgi:hypothetical protein